MDLSVREARTADAQAMLALVRTALGEPGIAIPLAPEEFTYTVEEERRILADYARDETSVFLVAERGGAIAGLLNLKGDTLPSRRHRVTLGMTVAAPHRRCGVGRALMETALDWAQAAAFTTRVELDVYARNTPARRLYDAFGFTEEARCRGGFMEGGLPVDTLLLGRALDGKTPVPYELDVPPYRPAPPAPADAAAHIRPARRADAEACAAAWRAMRMDPHALVPTAGMPEVHTATQQEEAFARRCATENGAFVLALAGPDVVGYAWAERGPYRAMRHEATVALGVADGWRGRGLGGRLMEELHDHVAARRDVTRLMLFVYAENLRAVRLYERCGYALEGRLRDRWLHGGRLHDELLMSRTPGG